jgi:hypothetical protein
MPNEWKGNGGSRRAPDEFSVDDSVSLRGGVRYGGWNATWPFARLTIDSEKLHIGGAACIWVSREQASSLRLTSGLISSGVQIEWTDESTDAATFWTGSARRLLVEAGARGWPIQSG